jgi:hypothetical protein
VFVPVSAICFAGILPCLKQGLLEAELPIGCAARVTFLCLPKEK